MYEQFPLGKATVNMAEYLLHVNMLTKSAFLLETGHLTGAISYLYDGGRVDFYFTLFFSKIKSTF